MRHVFGGRRSAYSRIALLYLLALACDSGDSPQGAKDRATLDVSGSARAMATLESGKLAATEIIATTVNADDNDVLLSNVTSIARNESGQLFVLDFASQTVTHFDARGAYVRTIGKRGSGPGEFRGAARIQLIADTLFVDDAQNARISAFSTRDGAGLTHGRARSLELPGPLSASGSFVMRRVRGSNTASDTIRHEHVDVSASDARIVAEHPMGERRALTYNVYSSDDAGRPTGPARGNVTSPHPFATGVLFHHAPDGSAVTLVVRTDAASTRANPFSAGRVAAATIHVLRVGAKADTLLSRTYSVPQRPVTDDDFSRLVDSLSNPTFMLRGVRPVADPREVRDSLSRTSHWPSVLTVLSGSDGSVWLRQPPTWDAGMRFWRLSATGEVLPAVEVPRGFTVLGVLTSEAWGSMEADDGSVSVVRVRVVDQGS